MDLKDIVNNYEIEYIKGNTDIDILKIENDSKKIKKDYMFIAEKGFTVDGHDYIKEAVDNGAVAIVIQEEIQVNYDITVIKVKDSIEAMAKFSGNFYKKPWEKLNVIGITGTNGKTSTTYLLKSILDRNNHITGVIGTNGALVNKETINIPNTTPNSLIIHETLYKMLEEKVEDCIMEVSSHALDLNRVKYMEFDIGVFTNLSKDHLDYHKTVEEYFNSKLKLFLKTKRYNIINIDDTHGQKIVEMVRDRVGLLTYGIKNKADIFATDVEFTLSKVEFNLNTPKGKRKITLNTPGEFSIYNALAAASVAYAYNVEFDIIKNGLESLKGVRGRFEVVQTNTDYTVIIDFAHTADGLEKVLTVIDQFAKGRKIVVFGAGGNRDKSKRPEMGKTVGKHADLSIVTSDNPRFEESEKIVDDVIKGVLKSKGEYVKIVDRKEAIKYALDNAKKNDIILLAGKGHETYTIIKDNKIPFDERKIVLNYLKNN